MWSKLRNVFNQSGGASRLSRSSLRIADGASTQVSNNIKMTRSGATRQLVDESGTTVTLRSVADDVGGVRPKGNGQYGAKGADDLQRTAMERNSGGKLTQEQIRVQSAKDVLQVQKTQAYQKLSQLDETATQANQLRLSSSALPDSQVARMTNNLPTTADDILARRASTRESVQALKREGILPENPPIRASALVDDASKLQKSLDQAVAKGTAPLTLKEKLMAGAFAVVIVTLGSILGVMIDMDKKNKEKRKKKNAEGEDKQTPTTSSSAAALRATTEDNDNEPNAHQDLEDLLQLTTLQMVIEYQKNVNGCYLLDKFQGTMTKVQALSCGGVNVSSAIPSCDLVYTSMTNVDDMRSRCSENTFIPCLDDTCQSIAYAGTKPATTKSVVDACAENPNGGACSTLCDSKAFHLPEHLELICVNMDVRTAYLDLMKKLDYNVLEMFPTLQDPNTKPPKPRWFLIGLTMCICLIILALGLYGYVVYFRRRKFFSVQ